MEYAHSIGSSSVKFVASSSSSSSLVVAPGLLPVVKSSLANNRPASSNPWAFCAVWANGNSGEVVAVEGVLSQRHVQPLTIPRAHKVCEYSFGNQHCPQWSSLNSQ